ncbi:MAG: COX15/CtaA family protein [Planctomyces sp.]|nr:COX15/CtaA family protein [Planctomyces sp.]
MTTSSLHRFAWSTVAVATVTLVAGALVTSKNAGMAFRDWPTSDGQFMLTYPWLADFARDWNKFLEHGHRLAGVLIGLWSIGLVVLVERAGCRPVVRWLARGVLLGVILQGLLGGFRVQLDARGLAMLHGAFAAVVLSLMGACATLLSPRWEQPPPPKRPLDPETSSSRLVLARVSSLLVLALLAAQFVVGGLIRHQGMALFEHLGLGILAGVAIIANVVIACRTREPWLRRSAVAVLFAGGLQILLGIGSWLTKFGFATWGYVAVADSILQVSLRSAHTVVGVLLVMTAVVHALRTGRTCVVRGATWGGLEPLPAGPLSAAPRGGAS